jgi:signal transduction histidine kinase
LTVLLQNQLMRKFGAQHLFLPLLLLLASFSTGQAQRLLPNSDTTSTPCIDISKISYVRVISRLSYSTFIGKDQSLEKTYASLSFKKGMVHSGPIPPNDVTKKAIIRFTVCNSADSTVSIWFFPGFFYWNSTFYRQDANGLIKLPATSPPTKDNLSYQLLTLVAHDSAIIYAELDQIKTYINSMRPRLVHHQRLESFITDLQASHNDANMVTFLFSGLLLMMILFSIANYFQGGNKEFLFYSGYALFLGGMLFTKALYDFRPNPVSYFLESYLDFIMQSIGIIFYMLFMQGFLQTKQKHPFLHRFYSFGIALLIISMLLYSYLHYFSNNFALQNLVENITKLLLLAMTIVFLIYGIRHWADKLLRYLFWGNLFLFIFSLISQLMLMIDTQTFPGILGSSLFYYEIGLFLELVFFLSGLNFKNKRLIIEQTRERERLKAENQLKEYEKEIAVYKAQQDERQRISADMHDELGAGMTAIRLMSEIARNKMKESTPVEIEKISSSADEVLNKMNAIIWSMNSGNDTVDNLISYIRSYALEYFDATPIDCKVITPEQIESKELTGDKRRNIFLCVKETLNNALKHSQASLLKIEFEANDTLVIRISDNGVGIDMLKLREFGNGLKNIARRMELIGGTYTIENNNGTVTTLKLPL